MGSISITLHHGVCNAYCTYVTHGISSVFMSGGINCVASAIALYTSVCPVLAHYIATDKLIYVQGDTLTQSIGAVATE